MQIYATLYNITLCSITLFLLFFVVHEKEEKQKSFKRSEEYSGLGTKEQWASQCNITLAGN